MDLITQTKNQYRLEEWQAVIKRQRASGESIRTYCQNNGIKEASYYYWLKKIRKTTMEEKDGATTFVPVSLDDVKETVSHSAASTAGILIQTREATITIRDGASPETIQAILKVMTASC